MARWKLQQSPGAEPGFFYGYIVAVAAFCSMSAIWGTYYSFGVFFKPVLTEFGWTSAMTSGAFSLSQVLYGLLGIVTGGFNDIFGPRIVLTLCGLLVALGYSLMSQISAVWQLYLFYGVIVGIGISGFYVPLLSTIARWFTKRRSMMTGIVLAGMSTGGFFIPPLANKLISVFNWRISYIILGILVLVIVLPGAQFLRRDPKQMGLLIHSENELKKEGVALKTNSLSVGEAIHTRQFWMVCAMAFCRGFTWNLIMVHIVSHTIEIGISAASAANILASANGLSIAGRVILGTAADRIGNRHTLIIGFIMISAALLWLVPFTEVWMLYLFAAVFGFGHGGGALGSPLAAGLFGLRSHGLIFGMMGLGYSIGAAIGPFLAGYIFDITANYQVVFLVSAAVGVAGLVFIVLLKPIKSERFKDTVLSTI